MQCNAEAISCGVRLSHAERVEPSHGSDQWRLHYNKLLQEGAGRSSIAPFDLYVPRI